MAAKQDYITIAPVTPKGKWTICVRRVGSKDRFAPVAEARTQTAADGIVDALNLMQGELARIERPTQRTLDELRETLKAERAAMDKMRGEKRDADRTIGDKNREIDRLSMELRKVELARDVLQKAARETA